MKNLAIIFFLSVVLIGCNSNNAQRKKPLPKQVAVISVSKNGEYAISSNLNRHAYLWNIKEKKYVDLGNPINIYSANFIAKTYIYLYQNDKTKQVYLVNAKTNKVIKQFNPGFYVYGETVTSDLKNYFAADEQDNLYMINLQNNKKKKIFTSWCYQDHENETPPPKPYNCASFAGAGKPFSMSITPDNKNLFISDVSISMLFNAQTGEYKKAFDKNVGQTSNAISPNGKYVITADSNTKGVKYDFATTKSIVYMYDEPKAFKKLIVPITSINYIDQHNYIVTYNFYENDHGYNNYLGFHNDQNDFKIVKWAEGSYKDMPLDFVKIIHPIKKGNKTIYPNTSSYLPVVATSPSAHILVIGQANGGGIMVYKYNPDTKDLKLVWAPVLKQ